MSKGSPHDLAALHLVLLFLGCLKHVLLVNTVNSLRSRGTQTKSRMWEWGERGKKKDYAGFKSFLFIMREQGDMHLFCNSFLASLKYFVASCVSGGTGSEA